MPNHISWLGIFIVANDIKIHIPVVDFHALCYY